MGPKNDEQYIHAKRLSRYYDRLSIVGNVREMKECFDNVISTQSFEHPFSNQGLNLNGIENLSKKLNNLI